MRIRNWLFRVRTVVRLRYWRCIATLCGDRAVERFRRQQKWGALFFLAITPLVSVLTFATTKFDGLWCRLLLTISVCVRNRFHLWCTRNSLVNCPPLWRGLGTGCSGTDPATNIVHCDPFEVASFNTVYWDCCGHTGPYSGSDIFVIGVTTQVFARPPQPKQPPPCPPRMPKDCRQRPGLRPSLPPPLTEQTGPPHSGLQHASPDVGCSPRTLVPLFKLIRWIACFGSQKRSEVTKPWGGNGPLPLALYSSGW